MSVDELKTVKDYKDLLTESMFLYALNQRLFKISRRKDPPYFSCSAAADVLVRPVKAYMITSSCKEKCTIEALESMLIEVRFWSQCKNLHFVFFFFFLTGTLLFRLQGFGCMDFQNGKFLLFELYSCQRSSLPIWSVIKCSHPACEMSTYRYIWVEKFWKFSNFWLWVQ